MRGTVSPTFATGKMARLAAFLKGFKAKGTNSRENLPNRPAVEPDNDSVLVVAASETVRIINGVERITRCG